MADSRVGAGEVKDETGIFYCARQKRNTPQMMGTCQKDTEGSLKSVPIGPNGDDLNNKIMPVTR